MKLSENDVRQRIERIRSCGYIYHNQLKRKVKIAEWAHYTGERKIKIVISYGFGASEVKETSILFDEDLDNYLKCFGEVSISQQVIYQGEKSNKYILKYFSIMDENNNLNDLRCHLFGAIKKLEAGSIDANTAKAIASLSQTILNSAKLQLEYQQLVEKTPDIKMLNQ